MGRERRYRRLTLGHRAITATATERPLTRTNGPAPDRHLFNFTMMNHFTEARHWALQNVGYGGRGEFEVR